MAQRGSDEIRTKAIADLARGYKPRTVAKRHDVHVSTVYYWRNQTQKARRRPGAAVSDARLLRGTSPFHLLGDAEYQSNLRKAIAQLDATIARGEKWLASLRGARRLLTQGAV